MKTALLDTTLPSKDAATALAYLSKVVAGLGSSSLGRDSQQLLLRRLIEIAKDCGPSMAAGLGAIKGLMSSVLELSGKDEPYLSALCTDLVQVLGRIEEEEAGAPVEGRNAAGTRAPSHWKEAVSIHSVPGILSIVLAFLKTQLFTQQWIVEMAGYACQQSTLQGDQSMLHVCETLEHVLQACTTLSETAVLGSHFIKFVEILELFYKTLTSVATTVASAASHCLKLCLSPVIMSSMPVA